jgi:hypothetical protein
VKLLSKDQKATWDWLAGKRPEAGQWVRAASPSLPPVQFAGAIGVQAGAGGVRIVPAAPGGVVVPPVAPALPVVIPPKG